MADPTSSLGQTPYLIEVRCPKCGALGVWKDLAQTVFLHRGGHRCGSVKPVVDVKIIPTGTEAA